MARLACKDINPDTDCAYFSTGEDKEDAARKHIPHAREIHGEDVKGISDEELVKTFASKAKE